MTELRALHPDDLAGLLRTCAEVLADHAAALDHLDRPDDHDASAAAPAAAGTALAGAVATAAPAAGATDLTRLGESVATACAPGHGRAGLLVAAVTAGWAEALRNADVVDGARMALMLEAAAEQLTGADDGAHPGGPAAVVAAAADAALAAADGAAPLGEVLLAAADGGLAELERGPVADPGLARRGVVDALAAGFLLVVDVMAGVVTGEPLPELPADPIGVPTSDEGASYLVRCRLEPAEGAAPEEWLPDALAELGDVASCAPVGATWTVEVRTRFPGAVVETVVDAGRPRELHIAVEPRSDGAAGG